MRTRYGQPVYVTPSITPYGRPIYVTPCIEQTLQGFLDEYYREETEHESINDTHMPESGL